MPRQRVVGFVSGLLIAMGLLGFVNDPVLGIFEVDPQHNLVHIVIGGLGLLLASRGATATRWYGRAMTVVVGVLTLVGFLLVRPDGTLFGHVGWNGPDNYLHLALTAIFAYVGFMPRHQRSSGEERRANTLPR